MQSIKYHLDDFFAQGSRHWKATSGPQLVWIFKQWVTRFNMREFLFTNIMTFLSFRYGDQCCPLVVDPSTWLALIAGIALATFFLRSTKSPSSII